MGSRLGQHGQQVEPGACFSHTGLQRLWLPSDVSACVLSHLLVGVTGGTSQSLLRPCCTSLSCQLCPQFSPSASLLRCSPAWRCLISWVLSFCVQARGEVAQAATDKRRFSLLPIFFPLSHAERHSPLAPRSLPLTGAVYEPVQLTNPAGNLPGKLK